MIPAIFILLQAIPTLSREPRWYEIIAGVLLIPATIFGIAVSWMLIKKTKIEAKKFEIEAHKIELEIREKELSIKSAQGGDSAIREIVQPLGEGRQIQYLILRFILLYIVLRIWFLLMIALESVSGAFQSLAAGVDNAAVSFTLHMFGSLIEALPVLGYITTAVIFGLPLIGEITKILGIKRVGDWFKLNVEENKEEEDGSRVPADDGK